MKTQKNTEKNSSNNKDLNIQDEIIQKNLTFKIADETFGIGIENVTQIIGIQYITFIPHQPEYVKGVINLRGQIIPVMEVRIKFGKPVVPYDDRTCIVVVRKDDIQVGLIVDRVSEVLNIRESEIAQTPNFNDSVKIKYISGIAHQNKDVIILLDIDKLLENETIEKQ